MALFPIIILAIIQGLTEFLPISSSGHLVLGNAALGMDLDINKHLVLNVAVHVGTLLSVLLYFRNDVFKMLGGVKDLSKADIKSENAKLLIHVAIASIPVILIGTLIHITKPGWLILLNTVAITTLLFGILLWIADLKKSAYKTLQNMNASKMHLYDWCRTIPRTYCWHQPLRYHHDCKQVFRVLKI